MYFEGLKNLSMGTATSTGYSLITQNVMLQTS
jgi:hypothetical protein